MKFRRKLTCATPRQALLVPLSHSRCYQMSSNILPPSGCKEKKQLIRAAASRGRALPDFRRKTQTNGEQKRCFTTCKAFGANTGCIVFWNSTLDFLSVSEQQFLEASHASMMRECALTLASAAAKGGVCSRTRSPPPLWARLVWVFRLNASKIKNKKRKAQRSVSSAVKTVEQQWFLQNQPFKDGNGAES